MDKSIIQDLTQALNQRISGEVRFDPASRVLYSTDASIYQIEPIGVVFPRTVDELAACVEISASLRVPILARGAGSSLAGQAIGPALILDCSRHLYKHLEINAEERYALAEPGVILASLNRAASRFGLQFGPDPASAERATIGGSLANNASGAHSILYGMAADHVIAAEVILADGSITTLEEVTLEEAEYKARSGGEDSASRSIEAGLYRTALQIRQTQANTLVEKWPRTWRRAAGYNLNYLLPWSPSTPPLWEHPWNGTLDLGKLSQHKYPPVREGHLNLAQLLAGSEGTLAIIRRAKIRLVPKAKHSMLGLLGFDTLAGACGAVPGLLNHSPAAIELIPESLIRLARSVPAYAHQLTFLEHLSKGAVPAAILVVEFAGDERDRLRTQVLSLGESVLLVESRNLQQQVWGIRKVGLGLIMSRPGDPKPIPFIEDLSVPVEKLGEFVRELEYILNSHGTHGEFYAHASAGCLHVRPLIDLKTLQGMTALRSIATEAIELTIRLGGSPSGEHGAGLARSEWLEKTFGSEILAAFRKLKAAADPVGLLNPGKILDAPPMDMNLRYGPTYQAQAWAPVMDFSRFSGLVGAIEQCNGAGVCRKEDGVMCPSFQASGEEMHSTRGRANLLRAMISGHFSPGSETDEIIYNALDLCLACKGCLAECPSGVDMARLKYEFTSYYYSKPGGRIHPLRDYIFGYIAILGKLGHKFAPVINWLLSNPSIIRPAIRLLGLSVQRRFPRLNQQSLHRLAAEFLPPERREAGEEESVLFLSDAFSEYFIPEIESALAALRVLKAHSNQVKLLPVIGAGRTLISKGFLTAARQHARKVLDAVEKLDPEGRSPVIGVEPSEIYTLRDEYKDLLPGDSRVEALARRAYLIEEYLMRPGKDGDIRLMRIVNNFTKDLQNLHQNTKPHKKILLHGHCHQKAQPPASDGYPVGVEASLAMLKLLGYQVSMIEAGCCGMAGAFGYEREHYSISMKIGELCLFPEILNADNQTMIAASGVSCQAQIADGTGKEARHPIMFI